MRPFCARDGYLHFLFAEEDDYYLDSLVRLDRKRYLYYCLKREGYQAVYFLEGTCKRLQIHTLEPLSMAGFQRTGARGLRALFSQPFKQSVIRERGYILYEADLPEPEDWYEGLLSRIGRKQDADAFVIPIHLFFHLYRDEGRREELYEQLTSERQGSILVVLAPSAAEDSMDYLLAQSGPFCSRLCPEVLRVTGRAKRVLLYEEMERELGGRYQVWNQMEREEILRMLRYGALIGKEPWPAEEERLRDMADLLYFWYHSPLFAAELKGPLPETGDRRLSALRAALAVPGVWQRLEEKREILRPEDPLTGFFHPQRRADGALRRLQGISVSQLMGETGTARCRRAGVRLTALQKDMRRVYSTQGSGREDEWLEFCLDSLERLAAGWLDTGGPEMAGWLDAGGQDAKAVERVLDFLEYVVIKDERLRDPELFARKAGCYRQIIELSMEIARGRRTVREYGERIRESRQKRDALLREILRMERERPELAGEVQDVLADRRRSGFSGAYLALSARKEELLRLDGECKDQERFAAELTGRISLYEKAVGQLELSIDRLSGDSLAGLPETMRSTAGALQSREAARRRLFEELEETMERWPEAMGTAMEKRPEAGAGGAAAHRKLSRQEIDEEFARIAGSVLEGHRTGEGYDAEYRN